MWERISKQPNAKVTKVARSTPKKPRNPSIFLSRLCQQIILEFFYYPYYAHICIYFDEISIFDRTGCIFCCQYTWLPKLTRDNRCMTYDASFIGYDSCTFAHSSQELYLRHWRDKYLSILHCICIFLIPDETSSSYRIAWKCYSSLELINSHSFFIPEVYNARL